VNKMYWSISNAKH